MGPGLGSPSTGDAGTAAKRRRDSEPAPPDGFAFGGGAATFGGALLLALGLPERWFGAAAMHLQFGQAFVSGSPSQTSQTIDLLQK